MVYGRLWQHRGNANNDSTLLPTMSSGWEVLLATDTIMRDSYTLLFECTLIPLLVHFFYQANIINLLPVRDTRAHKVCHCAAITKHI